MGLGHADAKSCVVKAGSHPGAKLTIPFSVGPSCVRCERVSGLLCHPDMATLKAHLAPQKRTPRRRLPPRRRLRTRWAKWTASIRAASSSPRAVRLQGNSPGHPPGMLRRLPAPARGVGGRQTDAVIQFATRHRSPRQSTPLHHRLQSVRGFPPAFASPAITRAGLTRPPDNQSAAADR